MQDDLAMERQRLRPQDDQRHLPFETALDFLINDTNRLRDNLMNRITEGCKYLSCYRAHLASELSPEEIKSMGTLNVAGGSMIKPDTVGEFAVILRENEQTMASTLVGALNADARMGLYDLLKATGPIKHPSLTPIEDPLPLRYDTISGDQFEFYEPIITVANETGCVARYNPRWSDAKYELRFYVSGYPLRMYSNGTHPLCQLHVKFDTRWIGDLYDDNGNIIGYSKAPPGWLGRYKAKRHRLIKPDPKSGHAEMMVIERH